MPSARCAKSWSSILIATAFLIFLASAGIYHFEHDAQPQEFTSIFHALWWSVVTLTTVGYGDVFPVTAGGRIFTGLLLLIGLGVIAIPSGLIASGMTTIRQRDREIRAADAPSIRVPLKHSTDD